MKTKSSLSKILSIIMCLCMVLPMSVSMFNLSASAATVDENQRGTGVIGTNSYGVLKSGITFIVQKADEITPAFAFNSTTLTAEMSDSESPVATYYYDVSKGVNSVSIPVGVIVNNKDMCNFMHYGITTSSASYKSNSPADVDISSAGVNAGFVHSITGPAPTKNGEIIEFDAILTSVTTHLTYFQINNSFIISAKYKIRIRLVGFDTTVKVGKTIASNNTALAYPDVYASSRSLAVYNVDKGSNYNILDASHASNAALNAVTYKSYGKEEARAEAYIDVTKYSDMSQTDIFFVHSLLQLYSVNSAANATVSITSSNPALQYTTDKIDALTQQINNNNLTQAIYTIPFKLNGAVPAKGESVEITVSSKCATLGNTISGVTYFYNSEAPVVLTVYGIDKTELKSAIDTPVLAKESYTSESYSAYLSALSAANEVYNGSTYAQTAIDTAKDNLVNAFNALKTVHTVTWKNSNGVVLETDENVEYGTTPSYDGETPTLAPTAQYTYTFKGWYPAVSEVTGDVTYTATYTTTTNKYTITWYAEDGTTVIGTSNVAYGSIPSFNGTVPKKEGTNRDHYIFDGYTTTPVAVTGPASYTIKYKAQNHSLVYHNDGDKHHAECGVCGYSTTPASHRLGSDGTCEFCASALADYSRVNALIETVPSSIYYTAESYNAFRDYVDNQIDWGVVDGQQSKVDNVILPQVQAEINKLVIKTYPVSAVGGSYKYERSPLTNCYMLATITASAKNGAGETFSYWLDTDTGKIASTYRNYSFFSVAPRNFRAVYGAELSTDDYFASKVVGVRDNLDGTYSILVEHSVSSRADINAHGLLFTFDGGKASQLIFGAGNTEIYNPQAARTSTTKTGLFEVRVNVPQGADTIYVRPYVVDDATGIVHYGDDATSFAVSAKTNSVGTTMTVSEIAVDEEPTETPEQTTSVIDMIINFIMKVVDFIKSVLGI